ncbi:integrin alpha [Nitrosomonas ureae]|uniref:FG-GAP repeat-containing protein n=1 Tax=Nitrosomonas ureae TaxID=44577 RepID=A0A1H9DFU4_9PROT|nr:integrin alpha [Nitrosomonas ureae]SEQ11663.1 FG-GAP repeat-containing protein [Nitrosomonas ureae]
MTINSINLSSLDGSNGFRLNGGKNVAGNFYYLDGLSVSSAGDINGDGFDDVGIGHIFEKNYHGSFVVFGKESGFSATMDLDTLNGENGFEIYGGKSQSFVEGVGDINGDGFEDVALITGFVSSYSYSLNSSAYVIFGKPEDFNPKLKLSDLDEDTGFRIDGVKGSDFSAKSFSGIGDINGDGFDDLIITSLGYDPYDGYSGASYVVFGKSSGFDALTNVSDLDGSNGFRINEVPGSFASGGSASDAGDINGDGFNDFIIGMPSDDLNGRNSGSSYVVFGKASGFQAAMNLSDLDGSNGFRFEDIALGDRLGSSVSTAGDVNGDGFDDVIVSDSSFSGNPNNYVVFGKASGFEATMNLSEIDGSNGFRLKGIDNGFVFINVISGAGDVNGDAFDDLIIGVPNADPNGSDSGSSYVLFGKASGFNAEITLSDLDNSNSIRLDGAEEDDESGTWVSGAGDVNGDGFDDLMIGAPGADSYGSSYVIFGRNDFTGNDVDFPGTPGDDIFTGTKAAESFEGGDGNDRMIGRGGADSFDGGAGNDYIRILGDDFQHVDGGTGTDTLGFAGNGFNLDLSSVIDNIHGIETIALYGVGDNTLTLTAQGVIDLSQETDTVKIKGNEGDSVVGLSSGWTDGGVHGNFHTYTQGDAVLLVGVNVTTDFPVA